MVTAENIKKSYRQLQVLKGVSLNITKGEIVTITGSSGAGKSTLLHILSSLEKADSGKIIIDNIDITKLNDKLLSEFRNQKIGFVFQFHHLLPEFTAFENICLPALIAKKSKKNTEKRAFEIIDFLQIRERANHKPAELSGGEQQRVAVARALINSPLIIMADEPSGNLDSENAILLHNLFFELREKFNQTFLIVTHNENLSIMSDRSLKMKDGLLLDQ